MMGNAERGGIRPASGNLQTLSCCDNAVGGIMPSMT